MLEKADISINPSFFKYMGHQRYLGAQGNSSFNPFLRRIEPKLSTGKLLLASNQFLILKPEIEDNHLL